MKANIKLSLLIISAFLFTFTSYVCAGTFTDIEWVDDSSIPLNAGATYTHAIDFQGTGGATGTVVINGVTLTQVTGLTIDGADSVTGNGYTTNATHEHAGVAALPASGANSAILKTGFAYAHGAAVFSITVEDLDTDSDYLFTWYSPNWDGTERIGTLDGSDDGFGAGETLQINQSTSGSPHIVQYAYNTGTSTSFTMQITSADTGNTCHEYAFTNQVVLTATAASKPSPGNGAEGVLRDVVLSWVPGMYAETHNVYIGSDAGEVGAADVDDPNSPAGVDITTGLTDAFLDIGAQTYGEVVYWRVDEVNVAPDPTVYPGPVWSFTVEPPGYPITPIAVSASSQVDESQGPDNTINESGLTDGMHSTTDVDSWLSNDGDIEASIQYDFDKEYKFVQMTVWNYNGAQIISSFGMNEVVVEYSVDDVNWIVLDSITQLTEATGLDDYTGETFDIDIIAKSVRITAVNNHGGAMFNKSGLSEIKFYYAPVRATDPSPASGTTDLDMEVTLGWRPGRGSVEHHVYISTDQQLVIDGNAPVTVVTDPELDLLLSLTNTYYWKVVEVNNANTPAEWSSDVWNFSSLDYYVIEDFEDYNDLDPNDILSNWSAAEGASIQNVTTVAHFSTQSMKLEFNNSTQEGYSEARLTGARNLGKGDPTALVFWVYGDFDNVQTEQMYVRISYMSTQWAFRWGRWRLSSIEQSAIFKNVVATSDLATPWWTQVTVPLEESVLNWAQVRSINIGLMRAGLTSGSGVVYVDDIRMYGTAPVAPVASDPGSSGILAEWNLDGNADDSSGNGYNGVEYGTVTYVDDAERGMVASFEGGGVIDPNLLLGPMLMDNDFTWSFWAMPKPATGWGAGNAVIVGNRYGGLEGTRFVKSTLGQFEFYADGANSALDYGNLSQDVWTQMVIVKDGSTLSCYRNGELELSREITNTVDDINPFYIGGDYGRGRVSEAFTGLIDDVVLYERALTADEARFLGKPTP